MTVMADSSSGGVRGVPGPADRDGPPPIQRSAAPGAWDFADIVSAYQDRLMRLAHRLLGWQDGAEDVVQEVFLAALKALPNFNGRSSLGTWLTAITVNKCRNHRRKNLLWMKFLAGARDGPPGRVEAGPANVGAQRERARRLRQAVQDLPGKYREVTVLRYLEEMPIAEIGEVLGLGRGAVDVRLHRARSRLKDALNGLIEE